MPDSENRLPSLAGRVFESVFSFRQRLRKGFDIPLPELRRDLQVLFDEMDAVARTDARLNKVYQEKGKYILAGMVDDVITNSDWSHAMDWKNHLLEIHYFHSAVASERIPKIIDEVKGNEEEAGLAELLFICLALGYQGRFQAGAGELDALRERLYRMIPRRLSDEEKQVMPETYEHTMTSKATRLRPLYTFMNVCVVSLMAVVLALTTFAIVYQKRHSEITEALKWIVSDTESQPPAKTSQVDAGHE